MRHAPQVTVGKDVNAIARMRHARRIERRPLLGAALQERRAPEVHAVLEAVERLRGGAIGGGADTDSLEADVYAVRAPLHRLVKNDGEIGAGGSIREPPFHAHRDGKIVDKVLRRASDERGRVLADCDREAVAHDQLVRRRSQRLVSPSRLMNRIQVICEREVGLEITRSSRPCRGDHCSRHYRTVH